MSVARVASLGMYDGPALRAANDALWSAVADRLRDVGVPGVPASLTRDRPLASLYEDDGLLLGQICGYPYASRYRDSLRVIGVPEYDVPGTLRARHRSFVVVGRTVRGRTLADAEPELRGARVAVNELDSMTGRHLLGEAIALNPARSEPRAPLLWSSPFFGSVVLTGSHARSLAAVARGDADVAAIDCVSFDHLTRSQPHDVLRTRILHRTRTTAGLPFVVAAAAGEVTARLVALAVTDAIADPANAEACATLRLVALRTVRPEAYDASRITAQRADAIFGAGLGATRVERLDGARQSTIASDGGISRKRPSTSELRRSSVAR